MRLIPQEDKRLRPRVIYDDPQEEQLHMTIRDKALELLIKSEFVKNYVYKKNKNKHILKDVQAEIYLIICETPAYKWYELHKQARTSISAKIKAAAKGLHITNEEAVFLNQCRRYVAGLIDRQLNSKTSTIYTKYYKRVYESYHSDDFEETQATQDVATRAWQQLGEETFYDKIDERIVHDID